MDPFDRSKNCARLGASARPHWTKSVRSFTWNSLPFRLERPHSNRSSSSAVHKSHHQPTIRAPQRRSKLQPGDPPIDVNAADAAELVRIPGVGPVTAQNILTARAERPFTSVADLDRVRGIGPKTLDKIRPYVVVK